MIFFLGLGLVLLLCCFIFIRLEFNINIEKPEKGFVFILKADLYFFSIHKLIQYRYENPDFQLFSAYERIRENSRRLKERSMSDGFKAYLIRLGLRDYKSMVKAVLNYLIVEKIDWKTDIGLQDAMNTGIGTGSIWAMKGIIVSFISIKSRLEKLHLKVNPDYSMQRFSSELNCIIRMRIVHIIFITSYLIFLIVRGYINEYRPGKTAAGASHRRTYENSYAEY